MRADARGNEGNKVDLALEVSHLSFSYAAALPAENADGRASAALPEVLHDVSLTVPRGAFCLLVGPTGCGKTTLLRLCKPELAPVGERLGEIRVLGRDVDELARDPVRSATSVGYVAQDPENQIVCDTVWREMAFGLESVGIPEPEMRRRVAETCYYLGMEPWFRASTSELSGGRKQVLALASALAMRPGLLLLDEPTSMLDPVAERTFLSLLEHANRELGVTVVVATHRPDPMAPYATQTLSLPGLAGTEVAEQGHSAPLPSGTGAPGADDVVELRDVWYRYARTAPWVLRGASLDLHAGQVRAMIGGNGSGKSTLLRLAAGVARPQRGRVRNLAAASQALLPQEPKALLSKETVGDELMAWSATAGYADKDARAAMEHLRLSPELLDRHPYDLSGGQQQLLALAKLLLARPRLLLLDEPTKGLDAAARDAAAQAIRQAVASGAAVLIATHDMDLVRATAHEVTMLFDGQDQVSEPTTDFLAASWLWRG